MNIAVYVRVSTQRQAQAQTIEQQLERLQAYYQAQGWSWQEENIFFAIGNNNTANRLMSNPIITGNLTQRFLVF